MVNDIAVQEFIKAVKEEPQDTNKTYNATVSRVDGEGVVWVNVQGSEKETPTSSTSTEVKRGDSVTVNWRNNKLYIGGNYSNPSAGVGTVAPSVKYVNDLINKDISVASINTATGYIGDLTADNITAENIKATNGYIQYLVADDITAEDISASSGYIKDLESENITAENIIADHETVESLDANYAHITNGVIDNATIDYADVNNLDANYAHLTNGVIDNATISYADVDDLNANYAEIDLANVNNAWIDSGILKDASITDAKIIGVSANKLTAGTIDASNITVTNLNASNITAGSLTVDGITIDIDNNEASIDGSYIEDGTVTLNGLSQEVTDKIDGAIETFTGNVVPTLNNYPASSWTTSAIKDTHIGDVYYVINAGSQADGYCYRFAKNSGTYQWVLIKDSDVTAALQRLTEAEGDIDDLEAFESTTSSWITNTDEELSSIKTNVTSLTTRMGDAEDEIETKVDTSTFNTLSQTVGQNSANITSLSTITTNNGLTSSTNITDTVNTVSQTASGNSSKISSLTTTLGTNADGTTKAGDIVHQVSQIDQDLDGVTTRVSKTEVKLAGQYATSSTGAGTTAKVATITPAVTGWTLYTGATVTVKFSTANTATTPTLNVNSTGAKTIKGYKGAALTEKEYKWAANDAITFIYDGTNWLMQSSSTEATRLSTAEASITTNAGNIALKANASDVYTKTAADALLEVKANKDTLTSEINASADTVQIDADRVNIAGATIFTSGRLSEASLNNAYDTKGSASAVQTNLDNLEVGGRNILLNTKASSDNLTKIKHSSSGISFVTEDGIACYKITGNNTAHLFDNTGTFDCMSEKLKANTTYTYSAYIKSSIASAFNFSRFGHFNVSNSNSTASDKTHEDVAAKRIHSPSTISAGTWTKISITFTTNNLDGSSFGLYPVYSTGTDTVLYVYGFKLEKGNKATDWTPAPEDSLAEEQRVYYRSNSTSTPTAPSTWVTSTSTANSTWTTKRMQYDSTYKYLFTCIQRKVVTGDTTNSTVLLDDTTTVIDGGNIITGTVTANQIAANAVTADKIAASSIAIGKLDSSTQTKVNNGDSALTKVNYYNRTCLVGNSSNTQTKYWRKFASYSETRQYVDPFIIFDVMSNGDFSSLKQCGRIKAHIRTTSVGAVEANRETLEWINRSEGITLSDFVLAYKATSGTDVKIELWCRCPSSWSGYRFNMVQEGDRTTTSASAMWTLYNDFTADGVESITSGYTQIVSTDIDVARKTATSYITDIGNDGIRVHDAQTLNNSIVINSDGMEVFKGGTGSDYSVAKYGDIVRVGKESSGYAALDDDGMDVYLNGTSVAHYGDYARIGKDGEANTTISPNEVVISASDDINALKITPEGNTQVVTKSANPNTVINANKILYFTHLDSAPAGTELDYFITDKTRKTGKHIKITKGTAVNETQVTTPVKFKYSSTTTTLKIINNGTSAIYLYRVSYRISTTSPLTEINGVLTLGNNPSIASSTVIAIGSGTESTPNTVFEVKNNGTIYSHDEPILDFVINQGVATTYNDSTGTVTWYYRKWKEGTVELWGKAIVPSHTYGANGGSYCITTNLPSGLIASGTNPVIFASGGISSIIRSHIGFTWISDTSLQSYLINQHTAAVTNTGWVFWHIIGQW